MMNSLDSAAPQFTWVPFYKELAPKLLAYEHRQGELIEYLDGLRLREFQTPSLMDSGADNQSYLLREIDPFTFFGVFNRKILDEKRISILREIKAFFNIQASVPQDFHGVPRITPIKSWFFPYAKDRHPEDVSLLWQMFRLALSEDVLNNDAFWLAFDRARSVKEAGGDKLTKGLFWIRPDVFLTLDIRTRAVFGFTDKGLSAQSYRAFLARISSEYSEPPYRLSHIAFEKTTQGTWSKQATGATWLCTSSCNSPEEWLATVASANTLPVLHPGDTLVLHTPIRQTSTPPFPLPPGKRVSFFQLTALGQVQGYNEEEGLEVVWQDDFQRPTDWYFYTFAKPFWRLKETGSKCAKRLRAFIFDNTPQDYRWFMNTWEQHFWEDPPELQDETVDQTIPAQATKPPSPYTVLDALADGVFMEREDLDGLLTLWRRKKNLILQGPPGVGKSFVAEKLAWLLLGCQDPDRVTWVQFHQSYGYEEFIRGYRPGAQGFELIDGIFYTVCQTARQQPDQAFVVLIDEINRGNLSQIFGELMLLVEAEKRGTGIRLMHSQPDDPLFTVPPNVYLLGTMNIADRSLAMVDYALRRRFGFHTLSPQFEHPAFRRTLRDKAVPTPLIQALVARLGEINQAIEGDPALGAACQVGHSFFCNPPHPEHTPPEVWLAEVFRTEIAPLLHEYWPEQPERVKTLCAPLATLPVPSMATV